MSGFGTMSRQSAFAVSPVLLLAALVLGVDGMQILPQTTSPGVVTKYVKAAIASYKDRLQLSGLLDKAMPDVRVRSKQPLCERLSMQGASTAAVQDARALKDSQWSRKNLRSNAIQLTVNHEPISGVTGKMLVWAWSNLDMMVKAPGDDKEQQMYLLQHPIDHVSLTQSETPVKVVPDAPWKGTQLSFQSYFGAGCAPEPASDKWSVSCSLSSAPSCASDSSSYKVPSFDNTRHSGKGPGSTKNPTGVYFASLEPTNITLVSIWDGNKAWTYTLALTEEAGQLSGTTIYTWGADGMLGRAINEIVLGRTLAAEMGGNIEQTLPFYAAHEVQEFGFYPSWLPAVYEAYHATAEPADSLAP